MAEKGLGEVRFAYRYCGTPTQWSCMCAPCLHDMDKATRCGCMFVCSPMQNVECLARHSKGDPPTNLRAVAATKLWMERKSGPYARQR